MELKRLLHCRSTGILPVSDYHGQDARATQTAATHSRAFGYVIGLLFLLWAAGVVIAGPATTRAAAARTVTTAPVDTGHTITLDGKTIHYRATAAEQQLTDDSGKPTAKIFYVAYEKIDGDKATSQPAASPTSSPASSSKSSISAAQPADRHDRPITFVFNGGPGAAAVWLHLGAAGPKRVVLAADGFPPKPPYQLTDNAESWLDLTDLVFIDPVGTGFSRAADPDKAKAFYNTHADIESVADFIRLYCTHNNRWLSPKYLAGESYGTTRAAGLSQYLHDRYGIDLNGIVLISSVLNFQTIIFNPGNDTPYPLYLPTYTAIAHYHKKLSPDLEADFHKTLADAQHWAQTTYATALTRGTSLDPTSRKQIVQQLAAYTGLPESYVERSNLRITPERFEEQLLADQQKVIGRFDGRITGDDIDPLNDSAESDPSLDGYLGVFSDTINEYLRHDLKFDSDEPYEVLSPRVGPWDFESARGPGGYLNVGPDLTRALVAEPNLKVLICCGYYDLATPFATVDYTVNALPLSPALRPHVMQAFFESGHMIYLSPTARRQLKARLGTFYREGE